jgi:hypothetical protein
VEDSSDRGAPYFWQSKRFWGWSAAITVGVLIVAATAMHWSSNDARATRAISRFLSTWKLPPLPEWGELAFVRTPTTRRIFRAGLLRRGVAGSADFGFSESPDHVTSAMVPSFGIAIKGIPLPLSPAHAQVLLNAYFPESEFVIDDASEDIDDEQFGQVLKVIARPRDTQPRPKHPPYEHFTAHFETRTGQLVRYAAPAGALD